MTQTSYPEQWWVLYSWQAQALSHRQFCSGIARTSMCVEQIANLSLVLSDGRSWDDMMMSWIINALNQIPDTSRCRVLQAIITGEPTCPAVITSFALVRNVWINPRAKENTLWRCWLVRESWFHTETSPEPMGCKTTSFLPFLPHVMWSDDFVTVGGKEKSSEPPADSFCWDEQSYRNS